MFELRPGSNTDCHDVTLRDLSDQLIRRVEAWRDEADIYLNPLLDRAVMDRGSGANQASEPVDTVTPEDEEDSYTPEKEDYEDIGEDFFAAARITGRSRVKRSRAEADDDVSRGKHSDHWHEVNHVSIRLVSSIPTSLQEHPLVANAATIERELRRGQANDALKELRTHLVTSYGMQIKKKKNVTGQRMQTRALASLRTKQEAINTSARNYRKARAALIALGLSPSDHTYKPLARSDIKAYKQLTQDDLRGTGGETTSWIWDNLEFVDLNDQADYNEYIADSKFLICCSYSKSLSTFSYSHESQMVSGECLQDSLVGGVQVGPGRNEADRAILQVLSPRLGDESEGP